MLFSLVAAITDVSYSMHTNRAVRCGGFFEDLYRAVRHWLNIHQGID